MNSLVQLENQVDSRVDAILRAQPDWPCRKGCDYCCRHLASVPLVSEQEWQSIHNALSELPAAEQTELRERIRQSRHLSRPVICPLLDVESGACSIYAARPLACRTYGFYMDRDLVLGCAQIEAISRSTPEVVWGNHSGIDAAITRDLGPLAELYRWLDGD